MSGKFNDPRLMGNCKHCYYYTPNPKASSEEGVCHRYPQSLDKWDTNYCGEFAWKSGASLVKEVAQ